MLPVSNGVSFSDNAKMGKIEEINATIIELLHSQMVKIKELMNYISESIEVVLSSFAGISIAYSVESNAVCTSYRGRLYSIIRLVDTLFKLDSMKDMRDSMKDDFLRYKRAISTHSTGTLPAVLAEMMSVQLFLCDQDPYKAKNCVLLTIRDRLKQIGGYDRVLNAMLDMVISDHEANLFVTPDEKFRLIRVVPHLMVLIDGDPLEPKSQNVFKRHNASVMQKLFKRYPILPLHADMSITLLKVLERAPHFNKSSIGTAWGSDASMTSTGGKIADLESYPEYDLKLHWSVIREEFPIYAVHLTAFLNQYERSNHDALKNNILSDSPQGLAVLKAAETASKLALRGLDLLSKWKSHILLSMAWKYTHPACAILVGTISNTDLGQTHGYEYEQAVKNNFIDDELSVLVDTVSLIKSLASLLCTAHHKLAPLFRVHQHHRIQQVSRGDLVPLLHRVDKRKKSSLLAPLLQIMNVVADYGNGDGSGNGNDAGKESDEEYKMYSRKQGQVNTPHTIRAVAAGASRLYILRSRLHGVYDERSVYRHKVGLLGKPDLEKEDITLLETFYEQSFFYPYLLDFSNTLREVSSMADLWYREFHIEISQCVQFSIDISLPWILIQRALAPHLVPSAIGDASAPMIQNIIFMLDIYNDAAYEALHLTRVQHLYDEVEAEASLVLSRTMSSLSHSMYAYYKDRAATSMLGDYCKRKLEGIAGSRVFSQSVQRYDTAMSNKNAMLLGRSINFSAPFIQFAVKRMRRDIDAAIRMFESSDISGIVELASLLDIIRETHTAIADLFDIQDYRLIFKEINDSFGVKEGRILKHMLASINLDIASNFSYNLHTNRLVRTFDPRITNSYGQEKPRYFGPLVKSKAVSDTYGKLCYEAYKAIGESTKGFFGRVHIETIISLSGCPKLLPGIFITAEQCLNILTEKLADAHERIGILRRSMTPCKPPPSVYNVASCVAQYEADLEPLLKITNLKENLFQAFSEIGNIVLLLKDISDSIIVSLPLAASTEPDVSPLGHLLTNPLYPTLARAGKTIGLKSDTTLFHLVLQHIDITMEEKKLFKVWTHSPGETKKTFDLLINEFHVIWSTLSFMFCLTPPSSSSGIERFGDGFQTAGCIILHHLAQRDVFELHDMCHHILRLQAYESRSQPFDQIRAFGSESAAVSAIAIVASLQESDDILAAASEYCAVQFTIFNMLKAVWGTTKTKLCSTDSSSSPSPSPVDISGGRKIKLFKVIKRDIIII